MGETGNLKSPRLTEEQINRHNAIQKGVASKNGDARCEAECRGSCLFG